VTNPKDRRDLAIEDNNKFPAEFAMIIDKFFPRRSLSRGFIEKLFVSHSNIFLG